MMVISHSRSLLKITMHSSQADRPLLRPRSGCRPIGAVPSYCRPPLAAGRLKPVMATGPDHDLILGESSLQFLDETCGGLKVFCFTRKRPPGAPTRALYC